MLYIFTVATNIYVDYLDYQLKTYDYLFPGYDKKIIWFTDNVNKCQELANKYNYDIDIIKVVSLVYPFNTLFKTNYITDYANTHNFNEDDIILFIDADTIFVKREAEFWNKMFDDINRFDCIFSISPWIFNNVAEGEQDKFICVLPNEYGEKYYIQDSFFIFKCGVMKKWQKQYDYYLREYTLQKKLPIMQDQTLLNYLIYKNQENYNIKISFYFINYYDNIPLDSCNELNYNDLFMNKTYCITEKSALHTNLIKTDNLFMLHKFNCMMKESVRNTNIFGDD